MDLRQRIIEASVKLIEKEGLSALSMREVARRAGVSHQAPYHHFGDRQAILAAIAGEGFRRLTLALADAAKATKNKSADAKLEAGGRAYVRFATTHGAYFRVMFRPELVDLDQYPEAMAYAAEAFAALEKLIAAAVEEGLISADLAEGTVIVAWSFVHGLSTLLLDGPLSKTSKDGAHAKKQIDRAFVAYRRLLTRANTRTRSQPARRNHRARR